ncbi:hypothetical protein B0J18DRAFT_405602 [Chaetomium sp. MPI-SDFR-AT-0129]|nr:hypothetical protein B0J18DRAFT_405602 [Chaetomium sp. MPI-SDFR-AT-0129]
MPPIFQPPPSPFGSKRTTPNPRTILPRSSPGETQPAGLIALGVCLGVVMALVLIWYTCCRAQRGPFKEIQMYKKGSRLRKEVRSMRASPLPRNVSERPRSRARSLTSSDASGSGSSDPSTEGSSDTSTSSRSAEEVPPPQAAAVRGYWVPVHEVAPSEVATESDITEPPMAHTHNPMNFLDPSLTGSSGRIQRSVGPPIAIPGVVYQPNGVATMETPLGRQAVTDLPAYTRNLGAPQGHVWSYTREGRQESMPREASGALNHGTPNWWEAGSTSD